METLAVISTMVIDHIEGLPPLLYETEYKYIRRRYNMRRNKREDITYIDMTLTREYIL